MTQRYYGARHWTLALTALAACSLEVDGGLVREAGATPEVNVDPDGGDERDADGKPDADIGPDVNVEPDGAVEPPPDGRPPCDGGACLVSCDDDSQCAADEFCSSRAGGCTARCSDAQGCAGPSAELFSEFATDGETVFFSVMSERDSVGNFVRPGKIMAWDLNHDPVNLASDLRFPRLLFVADGYLYFAETTASSVNEVQRLALSGATGPERLITKTLHAWATPSYVYWSVENGAAAELWRSPRTGTWTPELVRSGSHEVWFGGSDAFVVHPEQRDAADAQSVFVVADSLLDTSAPVDLFGPGFLRPSYSMVARGNTFYIPEPVANDFIVRIDLAAPSERSLIGNVVHPYGNVLGRGDSVYWSGKDWNFARNPNNPCLYYKVADRAGAPSTEIHRVDMADDEPNGCAFTMLASWLVYFDQGRLFTKAISQ